MKRAYLKKASAFLDSELPAAEKEKFELQLKKSPQLNQEYESLKQIKELCSTLPRIKTDRTSSLEAIRRKIAAAEKAPAPKTPLLQRFDQWLHIRFRPVIAATASLAIALFILFSAIGDSPLRKNNKNIERETVAKSSTSVAEKETDEIIRNYEEMSQLYYY